MQVPTRRSEKNIRPRKSDFYITKEKYNELTAKLARMKRSRPALISEVQRLGEMGDFSENAEYQIAKGKLRGLNNWILRVEDQINRAEIIKLNEDKKTVRVGHVVKIKLNGVEKTYQILGSAETNPTENIISRHSPLGQSLLEKKVGEIFEVELGGKEKTCKIIEIK